MNLFDGFELARGGFVTNRPTPSSCYPFHNVIITNSRSRMFHGFLVSIYVDSQS